ncbi:MAG: hypothetical protein ROW48_05090 [Bellilinea sp.]|jgi:hypothetical protein
MAAQNEVQLAKQAIQSLVGQLDITQIIYVDDYFEARFDVEVIIGWLYRIPEHHFAVIEELLPGISLGAAPEIWTRGIRNLWEGWPLETQKERAARISAILGTRFSQDYQVANRLSEYFPRRIAPKTLSPSEWIGQREQILSEASPKSKILCMFDQDLSEASDFQDAGPKSGMGLIQEIINRGLQDVVICCLLTHTISSVENEMPAWRNLAQENEIDLYQFMPLAKIRLSDGESPLLFADGIKKALLNLYCEKWKCLAVQVIKNSTEKAVAHVMNVDVYDFDLMIFQVSFKEGIWEMETLVRLFQIFHRDEIRELVLDPQMATELSALIRASRPISAVEIDQQLSHTFPQIRPIRRKELYEPASLVIHTPLEVGDIFEKKGNIYILLGQSCDLMVRSVGKRASDRLLIPLVPLRRITHDEFDDKPINHWKTHAALNYFYPDSNDIAEVVFAETEWVDIGVLDLAVLDPDGKCRLDLNKLPSIPEVCTSGWKKHLESLIIQFSEVRGRLDKIHKHVNRIKKQETKDLIRQTIISTQTYSKGVYDFGLQRVSRYRQPGSERLLKTYTHYLSRDADDTDFAKDLA